MRLTVTVPDPLYFRLLSESERRHLAEALVWVFSGPVQIEEMRLGNKVWRPVERPLSSVKPKAQPDIPPESVGDFCALTGR